MASYNITEVVTGGVVLAAAAAFALYATQTTGLGSSNAGYDLTASFRSLEGVSVGTDVRLAGVKIGAVSGVELDTQTYRAVTTISVREGIEIPDDSAAIVASEGLVGGNFVEINPGGSFDYFAPGDEIEDTQGAVSLISLLVQFVAGSGGDSEE